MNNPDPPEHSIWTQMLDTVTYLDDLDDFSHLDEHEPGLTAADVMEDALEFVTQIAEAAWRLARPGIETGMIADELRKIAYDDPIGSYQHLYHEVLTIPWDVIDGSFLNRAARMMRPPQPRLANITRWDLREALGYDTSDGPAGEDSDIVLRIDDDYVHDFAWWRRTEIVAHIAQLLRLSTHCGLAGDYDQELFANQVHTEVLRLVKAYLDG